MRELYGILGMGTAPKKVITAGLDDIGTKVHYYIPWYGKVTEGLETVYDWLLDNEARYVIVSKGGTKVPKALKEGAIDHLEMAAKSVDTYIIETLQYAEVVKGIALILWDENDSDTSQALSEECIESELPTLELTNGLVPIILDASPETPQEVEEADPTDDESFDRPTLENMPAAVVKRMARDKGADVKTKDEAINAILGEEVVEKPPTQTNRTITKVVVYYSDGMKMEL